MNENEPPSLDFLQYVESLNGFEIKKMSESGAQLFPFSGHPSDSSTSTCLSTIPIYIQHHRLLRHPWLIAFSNAHLSHLDLLTWLHQRYLVSWCFPNWLMATVAKLPSAEARIPLLLNLYEEHGLGESHGGKPHPQMWRQLFEELGAIAPGEALPLPQSTTDLNQGTLLYLRLYTTACFRLPALVGLGAMAFVEFILPYENQLILQGLERLGISQRGREFFEVHCQCDEAHAGEILNVMEKLANTPTAIGQVWQGIQIAENARQGFYDALSVDRNNSLTCSQASAAATAL
ncbi:iron-containing redox enzyme family protein [Kovacikia minuta CCNUW1]|uniref:TenA family transcriptional regulator n=1 Tax=Kovacikia minuta TaxID=2931930 RepID=UPI001CC9B2EF|nr:iron-containing redox enzyme family protein [Kovacikia minuta]UBF27814.1 iron-containing redox enzyme family protein [Kovacikia minuta CCNUW1]